jgi:chondroitin AC lyase
VRGTGPKLAGAEYCNGEGVLCYNMSYGTNTCFMKSGKEYHDISSVWDYCKIPGTTAREETDESLLINHGNWHIEVLKDTVADGKVKGDCGIYSQNFKHEDISLKAAYFLYKGNMVCLGADVKDGAPEKGDVYTTVEQCIADNPLQISETIAENSGFVYRNLDGNTKLSMSISEVCGSWKRNNTGSNYPDETKTVFMLTIPYNSDYDKYAYMVSAKGYEAEVGIVRNDGVCQAVCFEHSTVIAVFHEDGKFEYNGKKYSGNKGELLIFD